MKKTFRSKVELLLLLPLIGLLLAAEIFMISNGIVLGIVLVGVIVAFITYLCFNTIYTITKDNKLRVKSGFFFEREIYIQSIKKIRPTHDRSTSPALSFDRLEICYHRYGRLVVSPNNKMDFIRELTNVKPDIDVEEMASYPNYHPVDTGIGGRLSLGTK